MTIAFRKITREIRFLDPSRDFEVTTARLEIRFDPLTHATGRVAPIEAAECDPPDIEALVEESLQIGCPFCKEGTNRKAATFPPELVPNGRIERGRAVVMPNVVPLDTYTAVCPFSDDHYIPLEGFTPDLMSDAFLASQEFFRRVASAHPEVSYFSVNWNHMPPAGSILVHPHLQPIAAETPTNVQQELIRASHEYVTHHITHFWRDLVETEETLGERYIGRTGEVVWLTSFVPTGLYPETMAVFWECSDLLETEEHVIRDFSRGLVKALAFYSSMGVYSLNLSLFSGSKGDTSLWVHARIIPRSVLRPIGNRDIPCFGMLHREPISVIKPEDMASRMRPLFLS